jgi:hypothetical protein
MESEETRKNPASGREIIIQAPNPIEQVEDYPETYVQEVASRVDRMKRVKMSLLRATDPFDWRDMGGRPYLQDSGIQKVAMAAGLQFGAPEITVEEGEDKRGKWTRFICRMSATCRGKVGYDEGISSTRDDFFGRKNDKDIPHEEVDIESVRKKSITNAQHRLLVKLCAVNGISWAQVEAETGIKEQEGVRYKGSERKTSGVGAWTPEKNRLWAYLLEMAGGDEDGAGERLLAFTKNDEKKLKGFTDPAPMTDKHVAWLLKNMVEPAYSIWTDQRNAAFDGSPPPAIPAGAKPPAAAAKATREPGQEG